MFVPPELVFKLHARCCALQTLVNAFAHDFIFSMHLHRKRQASPKRQKAHPCARTGDLERGSSTAFHNPICTGMRLDEIREI
jgi:hypothetical protein